MLKRIREARGQQEKRHQLDRVIDFDDVYFGGPVIGKKRGHDTENVKVFVALSLASQGNPPHYKMQTTSNTKQASVRKFAQSAFAENSVIRSDGYRSYIPALKGYSREHKTYDPSSGLLR